MANWGNRNGRTKVSTEDLLHQENQRISENLAGKVSVLKSLALDIDRDAKDQNKYLDGMGDDFDSSQGLLSGSMGRIQHMVGAGKNNRKLMCYIIMFLVGLFIICYYFISRVTAG